MLAQLDQRPWSPVLLRLDKVRDAAAGMGYGKVGRLFRIELPLALPGIMTGLRLATVSTVALVTVGSLVGKGGLGVMFLGGLRNNFFDAEIMTGAILCVGLALCLDSDPGGRADDAVDEGAGVVSSFSEGFVSLNDPLDWTTPAAAGSAVRVPRDQLLGGAARLRVG